MNRSVVDVLIVGGGPAGLATAIELRKAGARNVRVIEREACAGGIPRHSFHLGYGLRDRYQFLSGPAYARSYVRQAGESGVSVSTSTTATEWCGDTALALTSGRGLEEVQARAVVLATGARERGRNARAVPGTRPAGLYTTGALQQAVYLHQQYIGKRAVVVGAEHVSFSAVITLGHAGVRTVAMVTGEPAHQSYFPLRWGTAALYGYQLITKALVVGIAGAARVEGVRVRKAQGVERLIECDTVVFTGDWVPDHELARRAGLELTRETKSPAVSGGGETSRPGIYAIGNLVLPIKAADQCALDGRALARVIIENI